MRSIFWGQIACFFICLYFTACKSSSEPKDKPATVGKKGGGKPAGGPLAVEAYIIKTSVLNQNIQVPGSLLAFDETEIHPEVAGKIVQMNIREGAMVSRGTVLVKLNDADLQAQLHQLNVQLLVAQKTLDRQNQLLKIGGISQQDYDVSLLQVSSVRASMQVLQVSIARMVVRAPFNGKIGFKNVSIGAYVSPATVITTIKDVNRLKLTFSVPEKYNSKVVNGNSVIFSVEGTPKKYAAKIIATESGITENNRSLKVMAVVETVDKYISPGSFANVIFDLGEDNQALMVPTQSIIPGARDKQIIVARQGVATFQKVTTGVRDSVNVQLTSGVAVGDTVITTGILQLKTGSKIIVKSIKK
ncbi:MAG: efflux RND transporter periplasmic adaptor subunit [Chitinophagaceae bacterium]|nr:efflux RND transporter periplasmic adaptor subunit [Chitinophagaceae bacterium]